MTKFFMAVCAVMALVTTACTRHVIVEKPVPVYVQVRVACPSQAERDRLQKARPVPLRNGVMPTDPVERNGRNVAQLGLYEGDGAWADQVDSALDRCQQK